MSYVTIRRGEGEEVTVDLTPVEDYVSRLEAGTLPVQEQLEIPQGLDREQMRFLVTMLTGLTTKYKRLWEFSFRPEHADSVQKMRAFRELVGADALGEAWEVLGK